MTTQERKGKENTGKEMKTQERKGNANA